MPPDMYPTTRARHPRDQAMVLVLYRPQAMFSLFWVESRLCGRSGLTLSSLYGRCRGRDNVCLAVLRPFRTAVVLLIVQYYRCIIPSAGTTCPAGRQYSGTPTVNYLSCRTREGRTQEEAGKRSQEGSSTGFEGSGGMTEKVYIEGTGRHTTGGKGENSGTEWLYKFSILSAYHT